MAPRFTFGSLMRGIFASVPAKVSRRKWLIGGAVGLSAAALGLLRGTGYAVPAGRERTLSSFAGWQYVVVAHVARRITAPDPIGAALGAGLPTSDELDIAGFIDQRLVTMRPKVRGDLLSFIGIVEHVRPLANGYGRRFSNLLAAEQDEVLASLESSDSSLMRAGFEGLKALVFMGYYKDPRTWPVLGYEGPWVAAKGGS